MNKYCNRCQTLKPETDFARNNNFSDGLQAECKKCFRERYLERRNKKDKENPKKWEDSYC